jgi:hypothetical protein
MNFPRHPGDPEGGAHACAAFFYEAGCRLEKSLRRSTLLREVCTGKAFFGSFL